MDWHAVKSNYTALYMKPQRTENYLKFDIEFDNSVLKRVYMPSSLKSAVDFCHFWQNHEAQDIDNGSHTHTHKNCGEVPKNKHICMLVIFNTIIFKPCKDIPHL